MMLIKQASCVFTPPVHKENLLFRQQGPGYNTPERRKRLLELIDEYLEILKKSPFEKWNINGKVDYVLFKRNLESEQYQLLEEQKIYDQVAKYLTFSDQAIHSAETTASWYCCKW